MSWSKEEIRESLPKMAEVSKSLLKKYSRAELDQRDIMSMAILLDKFTKASEELLIEENDNYKPNADESIIHDVNKLYRGNLEKLYNMREELIELDEKLSNTNLTVGEHWNIKHDREILEREIIELGFRNDGIEETRELVITYLYSERKEEN